MDHCHSLGYKTARVKLGENMNCSCENPYLPIIFPGYPGPEDLELPILDNSTLLPFLQK